MRAIGFRVEPKAVHFAVVEGTLESPVVVTREKFAAPESFSEEQRLNWYRKRTLAAIEDHKINFAGMRFPEPGQRGAGTSSAMRRLRIEGVIMEALFASSIPIKAAGASRHIQSRLSSSHSPSEYTSGRIGFRGVSLTSYPQIVRDAIVIAVAALGG